MTGPGLLDDLTTQLTDFLGLTADLDLPKIWHVQLARKAEEPGWTATAQLERHYGAPAWEALHAWHATTGAPVEVGEAHSTRAQKPWRRVSVMVCVAMLTVRVWAHVPADDPIPAWAQPPAPQALTHAAFFTPRGGRDTGRAACGNTEGSVTTHPGTVTCATCRLILVMGEAA